MLNHYMPFVILIAHLGVASGQPVATSERESSADQQRESSPTVSGPILQRALIGVSKLSHSTPGVDGSEAENKQPKADPNAYIWARMSRDYLAKYVERDVNREKPASDEILGINFVGTSRTTGKTRLVLYPSEDRARGEVVFEGKIESRTTGHRGPATLYYLSNSTFRAHKPIVITEMGLKALPTEAHAPTRLTPLEIRTSLPRLRGRIAQRIAWRHVAESQAEADAIASDHRARDVRKGLDQRLDEALVAIQGQLQTQLAEMQLRDAEHPITIRSRSTPESVDVALLPAHINADKFLMPEFQVDKNPGLAVRVHRTLIARAMTDSRLRAKFEALGARILQNGSSNANAKSTDELDTSKLSMDSEWLAIDVMKPAIMPTDLRVATDNKERQRR